LILIALIAFSLVFIWDNRFYHQGELYFSLFDDAMISMTYARNLAAGAGLVWNPGEAPVEGYTNFLWVLWMALIHALQIPESKTSGAVMLTGVAVLVANLIVVHAIVKRLELRSPIIRIYALAAVAFSYPLLYWTLRGTEVGVQALLLNLCLLTALNHIEFGERRALVGFAIFTSLGFLVRPDFLLPAGGMALTMLAHCPPSSRLRCVLILGVITGITCVGLTTFRYMYFGDVLPNTYYLKVTGHGWFERVEAGARAFRNELLRGFWAPLVLASIHLLRRGAVRHPLTQLFVALVGLQILYSIHVGGDAFERSVPHANRFLSSVLPALILLSASGCEVLMARIKRYVPRSRDLPALVSKASVVAFCVVIAWAPGNLHHFLSWYRDGAGNVENDRRMSRLGLSIRELTPPDTVIAVVWAGAIPYFAHRQSIDLLGKNDARIARSKPHPGFFLPGHTKWDLKYSVGELRPDLIVNGWILTPHSADYFRKLGYRPAPTRIGFFATPELIREFRSRHAQQRTRDRK
jgi:hypothetical protein